MAWSPVRAGVHAPRAATASSAHRARRVGRARLRSQSLKTSHLPARRSRTSHGPTRLQPRPMRGALGLDRRAICCEDAAGLGSTERQRAPLPLPAPAAQFQRHWPHAIGRRGVPAEFPCGDRERVRQAGQCAPNLGALALCIRRRPSATRCQAATTRVARRLPWLRLHPIRRSLVAKHGRRLAPRGKGRTPDAAEMLARGYEKLRPCLRRAHDPAGRREGRAASETGVSIASNSQPGGSSS